MSACRGRSRYWPVVVLATAAIALVVSDRLGAFGYAGDDWAAFDGASARIESVIDGDTLEVFSHDSGRAALVRLIGIEAPDAGDFGHGASMEYTRVRTSGKRVMLRLEPLEPRDADGRLRGYVYLSDNECLNLSIVRDGRAYADRRQDHTFRSVLEQAENEARKKGHGQWKDMTFDRLPAWRRAWLRNFDRQGNGVDQH